MTGGANGEGTVYNLTLGYAPDSNVLTANDVNGNWTYTYDDFNRAYTGGNAVGTLSFDYDRYGNRWAQTATGTGNWPQPSFSFDAHNHIVGATYDGAGNLTNDALGHTYFYDAENRLIQVGGTLGQCATATACYAYDGSGRRISKTTGSATVYYVYDVNGRQVAEVSSAGAWNRGEVYAGGKHLATYDGGATGSMYFNATDWLGNERVRTPVTGPIVETCTNLPFGDDLSCTGTDTSPMHFTGQQRDGESGLDYFGARFHASSMGRFMSPDAKAPSTKHLENPQKWNKYSYVLNNPLTQVDPDGREEVTVVITAHIAQQSFRFPPLIGPMWRGDGAAGHGRNATSYRVRATVTIETDQSARQSSNPVVSVRGDTSGSSVDLYGLKEVNATSAVTATASGSYDQNGNAVVRVDVSGADPLALGAPSAAGTFSISVDQGANQIMTTGAVTPYPDWEGYASSDSGGEATLFQTNGAADDTPLNLFLGESQGIASWATFEQSDCGTEVPCNKPQEDH